MAEKDQTSTEGGIFQRIFSFLSDDSDPEREKKRKLKEIAKRYKKIKTRRYNPKQDLAEAAMAGFFFDIYKNLIQAQSLLSHADSSNALKLILVEEALSDEQLALKERISEEGIRQRAEQGEIKRVVAELKKDLKQYYSFFDIKQINEINDRYRHLSALIKLIKFDYYFLLKKFDSRLQEGSISGNLRFEAINAQYIVDELKDFQEILLAVDVTADWNSVLDVMKEYRGVEVIARDAWKKNLQSIRQLQKTSELEMVIRLIDKNPLFKVKSRSVKENIVEGYLSKLRMTTELTLQKIVKDRKQNTQTDLATKVFGTASISRLSNYSEKANILFAKKMLGGFIHINALNYTKAFLLDFVKKDVRQVVDLLLIPGKWTESGPSQTLSESFHQLLALSDDITEFDSTLADDGELGKKVFASLFKADRDKNASQNLRSFLKQINERAKEMVLRAGQQCINLANILKPVLEDYGKKHPTLIMNWRELEGQAGTDIKKMIIDVYKQLYYFVKLLKMSA